MATAEVCARNDEANVREVIQNLVEVFGGVLDRDIIESVAVSCNYNFEVTTNVLIEMLNNVGDSRHSTKTENINQMQSNNIGFSYANAASSQQYRDNEDVVIESEEVITSKPSSSNINLDPTTNILMKSYHRSKREHEVDRIIQHIRQQSRILILMRGLPGSGKSFLARKIVDRSIGSSDYHIFILSTDDYFFNKRSGTYVYNPSKLQEAHEWNQQRAYMQMSAGVSPVIIDNTNTEMWEMKSYAMMAANFGYIVEIVEPLTSWAFDVKQLFQRNKHNVPKVKLQEMLLRYEKGITPTNIFAKYNLSYVNLVPPVKRSFPPITSLISQTTSNKSVTSNVVEADLIGFDEESNTDDVIYVSTQKHEVDNSHSSPNTSLLDSFINEAQTNADVLKPNVSAAQSVTNAVQSPEMKEVFTPSSMLSSNEMVSQSSGPIKKPKDVYPTLNLSSWGLSQEAVSSWDSWDMVTPLANKSTPAQSENVNSTEMPKKVETSNCSTNTSSYDFSLLGTNCLTLDSDTVRIVRTTGRDINIDNYDILPTVPPRKILLHKSSMTDEDILDLDAAKEEVSVDDHIHQLISLFPDIPLYYLQDVYEKCGKNINWAVDLLLDDNKEILTDFNKSPMDQHVTNNLMPESQESLVDDIKADKPCKTDSNTSVDPIMIKRLKKQIEQTIEINKDLYSDHIMKIKNLKRNNDNTSLRMDQSSSSKVHNFEVYPTTSGEVIALDSNVDVNEYEPDIDFPQSEEADELQTVELNLGDVCINQLQSLFGFPEMFPKGFLPVIQIPLELAEQLHAFYIQSVLGQMEAQNSVLDMITKEDEELAKKLQKQDNEDFNDNDNKKTVDLQEIMKEQVADKLYRKKVDEWKKLTPDTLAARLTIQKLENSFPSVEKNVLMEILYAHNNSYEQTVEVLLASTDANKIHDPDGNVREPPISEAVINDMRKASEEKIITENAPDVSKTANEYREEANNYHKKHNEYMQKAQRAFQNRQYPVAQFYSDLAKSYTQLYEQSNSLAASAFLQEHSSRLQNFHTLDLHYLYVKEAIPALDMFLDSNINLMTDSYKKTENLFIITGRGKRSIGKSRLKPAVIARLRKRGLQWIELNPGLLKVRIHPHSAVTSNI